MIKYLLCPGGVPGGDLRAVLHAAERHGALHPAHAGPVQGQPRHLAPARRHQEEGDGGKIDISIFYCSTILRERSYHGFLFVVEGIFTKLDSKLKASCILKILSTAVVAVFFQYRITPIIYQESVDHCML